jgi:hypothetical protein
MVKRTAAQRYRDLARRCLQLSRTIRHEQVSRALQLKAAEFFELAAAGGEGTETIGEREIGRDAGLPPGVNPATDSDDKAASAAEH